MFALLALFMHFLEGVSRQHLERVWPKQHLPSTSQLASNQHSNHYAGSCEGA